jgi:hypothetical protein
MPFWCCRTEVNREHIAERFLRMAGYEVYYPRIRERGRARPLFPAYCFITAALQWYRARWSIGVVALLAGASGEPAIVADAIIMDLRNHEDKDGLLRLPQPPGLQRGDRVLIKCGPFVDRLALYDGQAPHERVAVLLTWLGSRRRIEMPKGHIAVSS